MSSTDMAHLPAASAPPGYTQDLVDPPETKHIAAGITISIVGMVASTLFISLRTYTKAFLARMFGVDDGAICLRSYVEESMLTTCALVALLIAWVSNEISPCSNTVDL